MKIIFFIVTVISAIKKDEIYLKEGLLVYDNSTINKIYNFYENQFKINQSVKCNLPPYGHDYIYYTENSRGRNYSLVGQSSFHFSHRISITQLSTFTSGITSGQMTHF